MGERGAWLACRARRPDAATRLYCFPHSGGSAGELMRWSDHLPDVEVWGVQLPGRGGRMAEAPLTSARAVVSALVEEAKLRAPFAFFGHSLGALLAFETARALRDRGMVGPTWLFASAYRAPHLPLPGQRIAHLDGQALIAALEHHGGMSPEIAGDPELLELVLPGLRGDLEIAESYRHEPGPPLDCGLVVTAGLDDAAVRAELEAWRAHTTGAFDLRLFPGGHFYLREQRDALLQLIGATLRRSTG